MSPLDPVDATPLEGRVRTLEGAFSFARGVALVVGALLTSSMGAIGAGALATRDSALAQGARISTLESAVASSAASQARREEADRTFRDQFIEMRTDLRAMRQEVESLSLLLQRQGEDRVPGAPPRRGR